MELSWSGLLNTRMLRQSVNEQLCHKECVPNVYNELSGIGPIWKIDPEGKNPQRYSSFI